MSSRAIIHLVAPRKNNSTINYSRRMYAIVRRYTPEAVEGVVNECFAELTGLRTFFKMTYQEITDKIISDLYTELGIRCKVRVAKSIEFDTAMSSLQRSKKISGNVSTYKEINSLFIGKSFVDVSKRTSPRLIKRVRLTVPFLGKVG